MALVNISLNGIERWVIEADIRAPYALRGGDDGCSYLDERLLALIENVDFPASLRRETLIAFAEGGQNEDRLSQANAAWRLGASYDDVIKLLRGGTRAACQKAGTLVLPSRNDT